MKLVGMILGIWSVVAVALAAAWAAVGRGLRRRRPQRAERAPERVRSRR
jgi:hypothetical protein